MLGAFRISKPERIRGSWDGNEDSRFFPGPRKEGILRRRVDDTCQDKLTATSKCCPLCQLCYEEANDVGVDGGEAREK
jgi:hypothetical protein